MDVCETFEQAVESIPEAVNIPINQLESAGFKNVFNITDRFEGDAINDSAIVYNGQWLRNGWKNSGIPWTYSIDPEIMKLPKRK